MAEAWDNSLGCTTVAAVMEVLQQEIYSNEVYGMGTAQEKVGLRGATTRVNYSWGGGHPKHLYLSKTMSGFVYNEK